MFTNKNFDMKTAKKLINDYGERINILTRENQTLKKQLEDAQTSLKINKEILFSHFGSSSSPEKSSFIDDIKKENLRLTDKITWLFQEKAETSKLVYRLQQELDNKHRIERELIEKEKTKHFVDDNKLMEKDFKISYLLKQLENKKKSTGSVLVIGDPNKFNVEMNSELESTRALIRKYTTLLQKEKQMTMSQSEKIKQLENIINNNNASKRQGQRKNTNNKDNNTNNNNDEGDNIEVIDCLFSSNDDDSDILDDDEDDEEDNDDNNANDNDDGNDNNDEANDNKDIKSKNSIQNIQFPQKVQILKTEQSKAVPKLDLSIVLSRYKKPDNLQIVDRVKKTNHSGDEYIDKLKAQIKIFKSTIVKYKARITKLKQSIVALKNQNTLLQKTLKINTHTITQAINESMNPNLTENNSFEDEDEDVVNKLNKEGNHTSITKNTEPNSNNNNNFNNNISFKEMGDTC